MSRIPRDQEFVRAKDLAVITGLSLSTIKKHATLPGCPCFRSDFCRARLFDRAGYLEWLKRGAPSGLTEQYKLRR